jgi:hypothetical protein
VPVHARLHDVDDGEIKVRGVQLFERLDTVDASTTA